MLKWVPTGLTSILAWCVSSARWSHIVAQLLHVFGHDVKRHGDKTLGANAGHCNVQRWRGCDAKQARTGGLREGAMQQQTFSAFAVGHHFRVCVFRPTSQQPASWEGNVSEMFLMCSCRSSNKSHLVNFCSLHVGSGTNMGTLRVCLQKQTSTY